MALLPGFGLGGEGSEGSGVSSIRHPGPTGAWKGWLPVAGASLAGAGLLAVLALGSPVTPAAGVAAAGEGTSAHAGARHQPSAAHPADSRLVTSPVFTSLPITWPRLSPAGVADGETTSLSRGLVGYWRFDDGYGSVTARDQSGNGNDCQLRRLDPSAAWTHGRLGGAVSLTGDGWLECPKVEALSRLSREITISLWVRRAGTAAHVRALVSRQFGAGDRGHLPLRFPRRPAVDAQPGERWPDLRLRPPRPWPVVPRRRHGRRRRHGAHLPQWRGGEAELEGRSTQPGRRINPLIIGGGINGPDAEFVRELFQGRWTSC